jgi:acyl carrier protein
VNQPLANLGVDSLMAVEMRNRIRAELDVDVPPTKFMEGISLHGMASFVLNRLSEIHAGRFKAPAGAVKADAAAAPARTQGPPGLPSEHEGLAPVERLSDQEVDAQLRRLLGEAGGA